MQQPLIKLNDIRCNLNREQTIQNFSWQISPGQQWVVLGRNGAGKTAIARLLGHQIGIASGTLDYASGFDPARDIAYVSFELQRSLCERDQRRDMSETSEAAFDTGTTVLETILQEREQPADFAALCQQYGLASLLSSGIRYLSSGEMRKVLLLRGLLQQPKLLILDEPLEGLDRHARPQLLQLLQDAMAAGQQMLIFTRRKQDLPGAINHIMLLDQLQVVASGDKAQVMASQAWRDVFPPLPPLPDTLPARDPSLPDSTPSLDQPAIEAHNLCASFQGVKVLDNIDLILRPGEHIAIRGPNGCGKSTLLNLLSGENHKAYGQDLKLFGRARGSGETLWQVKAHFGVVSNQVQAKYIRGWNALEVVISGFYHSVGLYRSFGVHERQAAMDWLHALQLQHLAMQHFATLSYGQQRMVLLARAMVTYPPILVLDEPCTGLDDYNRQWLLRMVDFIAANSNTQVMFVSHLADEVPTCINREMEFIPRKDGLYQLVARGAKTR